MWRRKRASREKLLTRSSKSCSRIRIRQSISHRTSTASLRGTCASRMRSRDASSSRFWRNRIRRAFTRASADFWEAWSLTRAKQRQLSRAKRKPSPRPTESRCASQALTCLSAAARRAKPRRRSARRCSEKSFRTPLSCPIKKKFFMKRSRAARDRAAF